MKRQEHLTPAHNAALLALLGLAVFAPLLLAGAPGALLSPGWLGGIVALAALAGALLVFWHAGALRLRFLVLFALAAALVVGRILAHT